MRIKSLVLAIGLVGIVFNAALVVFTYYAYRGGTLPFVNLNLSGGFWSGLILTGTIVPLASWLVLELGVGHLAVNLLRKWAGPREENITPSDVKFVNGFAHIGSFTGMVAVFGFIAAVGVGLTQHYFFT